MTKKVMDRKASDNEYLHKDFHGALSNGLQYLGEKYGEDAVREYLRKFTRTYYAPLISDIKKRGLTALKEHFEKIYEIEGEKVDIKLSDSELTIRVYKCPAVTHMRARNMAVSGLFYETSRTVNETLCEGTDFSAELIDYDKDTGSCIQRFYRR